MCGLCGVLGGPGHWTETSSHPKAFRHQRGHTRRQERQQRLRLANHVLRYYGLTVSDFAGASYILRSRTGRTAIVDNMTALWAAAESLIGRDCDPLDDTLLATLAR